MNYKELFRKNKYIRRFLYACGYSPSGPITLNGVQMDWTIDRIREMIQTWNAKEGESKMLLIYVMGSGRVGHLGTISSQELTGVDQTSSPQMSSEAEPSSKTEENELLTTDIDEVRRKFEHKIKMLGGEAQKIKRYGGNLDMVEGYIRGVKWALRKIWDIN